MSGWSTNMLDAPRGGVRYREYPVLKKGVVTARKVKLPFREHVLVAHQDGTVSLSSWIEKESRWVGFTADAPPVAWMPVPDAPDGIAP